MSSSERGAHHYVRRACTRCGARPSFNRVGKPGLCEVCIDAAYRALGVEPVGPHVSAQAPRIFRCQVCGRVDAASLTALRNKRPPLCLGCSVREIAERDISQTISVTEAAGYIISGTWVVYGQNGKEVSQSDLAAQMSAFWELVVATCRKCGADTEISAVFCLASADSTREIPCMNCMAGNEGLVERQDLSFAAHGLERLHDGYAKMTDLVTAKCLACGSLRKISESALLSGATPCLSCDSGIDPNVPHFVYIVWFPRLKVRKVGITNWESHSDRIAQHLNRGGFLEDLVLVPNRDAATLLESWVLESVVKGHRKASSPLDFPQGGWTETWVDSAPIFDLSLACRDVRNSRAGIDGWPMSRTSGLGK